MSAKDVHEQPGEGGRRSRRKPRWTLNSERGLELAAAQVCEILSRLDGASLGETLDMDARNYLGLVQVLVRLNETRLRQEWQRTRVAAEREKRRAEASGGSAGKGLTPETLAVIEEELNLL